MNKFTKLIGLGIASLAILAPQGINAADLASPTIDPMPNMMGYDENATFLVGEIQTITITWAGADLELNQDKLFKVEDWVTFEETSLFDYAEVSGDKLIINYPLDQVTTYSFYLATGLVTDKNTGNTNKELSLQYNISPLAITSAWFDSTPALNPESITALGPEISLSLPGYEITSVEDAMFFKYGGPYQNITDIDPDNTDGMTQVKSASLVDGKAVIDLGTTITTPGLYVLRMGSSAIVCKNDEQENIEANDPYVLIYKVQNFALSPADFSTINGAFPGLTVLGEDVTVSNPSGIQIFYGYYDTMPSGGLNADMKENLMGQGESSEDVEGGKIIYFTYNDGALYNGSYSVYIPSGSVKVNGENLQGTDGSAYNWYHFTIEGNTAACPAYSSDPEAGIVTSLGTIKVIWGNQYSDTQFYGDVLEKGSGNITLTLPNGSNASVLASAMNLTGNSDLDQVEVLASYLAVQTDGYTAPGKYTLTIPEGAYMVTVNRDNIVPNDKVVLEFIIEGLEMDNAQVNTPVLNINELYPAVEITYGKPVSLVNEAAVSIPVLFGGENIGSLSAEYINIIPAGDNNPDISTLAETGDTGNLIYLLLGSAGLIQKTGEYTIELPANIFADDQGAFNPSQTITVQVEDKLAVGIISPASGATFGEGENVVFTITFEGAADVVEVQSQDAPLMVTDYDEYDQTFDWTSDVLSIENNVITIDLGDQLEPATYYLSFRGGSVTVDGIENETIDDVVFTVEGDNSGVDVIGSAIGMENIYNLQGVKIDNTKLAKGIYIINGKKVMVK